MQENNKQNQRKRIWINIVLVFVILFTLITILGSMHDFKLVLETLEEIKLEFLFIALGTALLSFLLMSLSSFIVMRALNKEVSISIGFLIQATEPFFNGITPFSSGAQPFQLYYYNKHNVDPDQATSILVVNFILYQIVSVMLSTFGLIFFWDLIHKAMGNNIIYIVVGYSINTFILVLLFLMAYINKVYILFEKIFGLFERFKWTQKNARKIREKTFGFVVKFQNGVRFLFTKKRVFLLSSSTKLVSLSLTYATTIFIALALGNNFNILENFYLVFGSMLAVMTMMFVPLPGASGGTEAAFSGLMTGLFTDSSVIISLVTLMLLWRVVTYYFSMLYGLIAYLILQRKKVKDENSDIY